MISESGEEEEEGKEGMRRSSEAAMASEDMCLGQSKIGVGWRKACPPPAFVKQFGRGNCTWFLFRNKKYTVLFAEFSRVSRRQ